MSQITVIALGGSLMYDGAEIDNEWVTAASQIIANAAATGTKIGIVVGGGYLARTNISNAKMSGVTDTFDLDLVGIEATRNNAETFRTALKDRMVNVAELVPTTTEEAADLLKTHQIVVMGGTVPGHTTDAVSINLAVHSNATGCTIATNVDFVYDKAPQNNPDAIHFENMNLSDLQAIVGPPQHQGAGPNVVIDPIGVQVAIDNDIELALLNGRILDNLAKRLAGESFRGTIIEVN
ncbi:MAG: UMP kinase [Candidatus Thalassarchaeaceae archaeon]|jgi:uridylate kinase|nr:UMP kinase [Candidatus Thalassarchaeaceae archaeon]